MYFFVFLTSESDSNCKYLKSNALELYTKLISISSVGYNFINFLYNSESKIDNHFSQAAPP